MSTIRGQAHQYDAFTFVGRMMLATGTSGVHNGFPVAVVANCTVTDLEKRTGMALTHTGTKLPIRDLIRMAAQGSDNYLAVFDEHTGQPLHLGRAAPPPAPPNASHCSAATTAAPDPTAPPRPRAPRPITSATGAMTA